MIDNAKIIVRGGDETYSNNTDIELVLDVTPAEDGFGLIGERIIGG